MTVPLKEVLSALRRRHGKPKRPLARGAFEHVVAENAAYLVGDDARDAVFERLRRDVGVSPGALLSAKDDAVAPALSGGGMLAGHRGAKLIEAAQLAAVLSKKAGIS